MPSERIQRVIDGYLDEIEVAVKEERWSDVLRLCGNVTDLDGSNEDALTFTKLAEDHLSETSDEQLRAEPSQPHVSSDSQFAPSQNISVPLENSNGETGSLGGWLILVGVSLVIRSLMTLLDLLDLWWWEYIVDGLFGYSSYTFEYFAELVLFTLFPLITIGLSLWGTYLYFKKKRIFPAVFIALLAAQISYSGMWLLYFEYWMEYSWNTPTHITSIISVIPWFFYMRQSKQVKATFTHSASNKFETMVETKVQRFL